MSLITLSLVDPATIISGRDKSADDDDEEGACPCP